MNLSRHFQEKWRGAFGQEPSSEDIAAIINSSVFVSRCEDVFNKNGRKFRNLAAYVNFERRVALKIDEINGVAVTVITEADFARRVFSNG